MIFGVISPKMSKRKANVNVAGIYWASNREVVREEAMTKTILFPTRIVTMSLDGSSSNFSIIPAPFKPTSLICLRRILLMEITPVSTPEKRAERAMHPPINEIIKNVTPYPP
jgi:hypothetical protein